MSISKKTCVLGKAEKEEADTHVRTHPHLPGEVKNEVFFVEPFQPFHQPVHVLLQVLEAVNHAPVRTQVELIHHGLRGTNAQTSFSNEVSASGPESKQEQQREQTRAKARARQEQDKDKNKNKRAERSGFEQPSPSQHDQLQVVNHAPGRAQVELIHHIL